MTTDNRIHRALLTLLRAGLWQRIPDDTEALRLSLEEWADVMRLAGKHGVYGLVSQGLDMVPEQLLPPPPIRKRLALNVYKYEKLYGQMLALTRRLFAEYEARGLHPVLQKGVAAAALYERPELRPSGDVDIWFDGDEFLSAVPPDARPTSDGGVEFEQDGLDVELHRSLIDVSAPFNRRIVADLVRKEGFCMTEAGVRSTTPLLTMLMLNTHILKHLFGWGIGLRQVCDYAKARQSLGYEESEYGAALRRMGLARWTRLLDEVCDTYLCHSGAAQPGRRGVRLMAKILESGSFGLDSRTRKSTLGAFISSAAFSASLSFREWLWTVARFSCAHIKNGVISCFKAL